jgi:hypothetical protein
MLTIMAKYNSGDDVLTQMFVCGALCALVLDNQANTAMVLRKGGLEHASQAASRVGSFDIRVMRLVEILTRACEQTQAQLLCEGELLCHSQDACTTLSAPSPSEEKMQGKHEQVPSESACTSWSGVPSRSHGVLDSQNNGVVKNAGSSNVCVLPSESKARMHMVKVRTKTGATCVACGKSAADVGPSRLLKCSACTIAPLYCSAECQQACWKAHKAECKANRKASK